MLMNEVKVVRSHGRMNILQKDYKNFEKGTDKLRKNLIIYLKKVSLRNQYKNHRKYRGCQQETKAK